MSGLVTRLQKQAERGTYIPDGPKLILEAIAEIESLRSRLAEWESAAQNGHPSPCTLGPLCPYCEIDRVKARLAEAERERDDHWRWRKELADKLDEVEKHRDATAKALNKRENDLMALLNVTNAMMALLGYHVSISARDDRVQAVMDCLAKIDAMEI